MCVLYASEISITEDEPDYKPMSKVGICNQCNNTNSNQSSAVKNAETDDGVALGDLKTTNETRPVQFEIENDESSTSSLSAISADLMTMKNNSSDVPSKRKQWTREQKLEFIDLYKKCKNKAKATREFKARCKYEVKASMYNAHKLRNSNYKSKKAGAGWHAAFPDMEKRVFEEFQELCKKGIKVKEWWFRSRCKQLMAKLHPGVQFKVSERWFDRFKSCYDMSL